MRTLALPLLAATVLGASACGGSQAGPTTDLRTLFSGEYWTFSVAADAHATPQQTVGAAWGELSADAAGTTVGHGMVNLNGVLLGPSPPTDQTYTIDGNRTVTLLSQGAATYRGAISADGTLACWSAVGANSAPGITIVGRRESGHDAGSLSGRYHLSALIYSYGIASPGAFFGTITLDGQGVGSATTRPNVAGTVGGADTTPATYAVEPDGKVTGTILGAALEGAILAGGELVVLTGGTVDGQVPLFVVLVKAGTSASSDTVSGRYASVILRANGEAPFWMSAAGTVTAEQRNGERWLVLEDAIVNFDGQVAADGFTATRYSVGPDGAFHADDAVLLGGISPSGRVAALGGQIEDTSDPMLWLFLR